MEQPEIVADAPTSGSDTPTEPISKKNDDVREEEEMVIEEEEEVITTKKLTEETEDPIQVDSDEDITSTTTTKPPSNPVESDHEQSDEEQFEKVPLKQQQVKSSSSNHHQKESFIQFDEEQQEQREEEEEQQQQQQPPQRNVRNPSPQVLTSSKPSPVRKQQHEVATAVAPGKGLAFSSAPFEELSMPRNSRTSAITTAFLFLDQKPGTFGNAYIYVDQKGDRYLARTIQELQSRNGILLGQSTMLVSATDSDSLLALLKTTPIKQGQSASSSTGSVRKSSSSSSSHASNTGQTRTGGVGLRASFDHFGSVFETLVDFISDLNAFKSDRLPLSVPSVLKTKAMVLGPLWAQLNQILKKPVLEATAAKSPEKTEAVNNALTALDDSVQIAEKFHTERYTKKESDEMVVKFTAIRQNKDLKNDDKIAKVLPELHTFLDRTWSQYFSILDFMKYLSVILGNIDKLFGSSNSNIPPNFARRVRNNFSQYLLPTDPGTAALIQAFVIFVKTGSFGKITFRDVGFVPILPNVAISSTGKLVKTPTSSADGVSEEKASSKKGGVAPAGPHMPVSLFVTLINYDEAQEKISDAVIKTFKQRCDADVIDQQHHDQIQADKRKSSSGAKKQKSSASSLFFNVIASKKIPQIEDVKNPVICTYDNTDADGSKKTSPKKVIASSIQVNLFSGFLNVDAEPKLDHLNPSSTTTKTLKLPPHSNQNLFTLTCYGAEKNPQTGLVDIKVFYWFFGQDLTVQLEQKEVEKLLGLSSSEGTYTFYPIPNELFRKGFDVAVTGSGNGSLYHEIERHLREKASPDDIKQDNLLPQRHAASVDTVLKVIQGVIWLICYHGYSIQKFVKSTNLDSFSDEAKQLRLKPDELVNFLGWSDFCVETEFRTTSGATVARKFPSYYQIQSFIQPHGQHSQPIILQPRTPRVQQKDNAGEGKNSRSKNVKLNPTTNLAIITARISELHQKPMPESFGISEEDRGYVSSLNLPTNQQLTIDQIKAIIKHTSAGLQLLRLLEPISDPKYKIETTSNCYGAALPRVFRDPSPPGNTRRSRKSSSSSSANASKLENFTIEEEDGDFDDHQNVKSSKADQSDEEQSENEDALTESEWESSGKFQQQDDEENNNSHTTRNIRQNTRRQEYSDDEEDQEEQQQRPPVVRKVQQQQQARTFDMEEGSSSRYQKPRQQPVQVKKTFQIERPKQTTTPQRFEMDDDDGTSYAQPPQRNQVQKQQQSFRPQVQQERVQERVQQERVQQHPPQRNQANSRVQVQQERPIQQRNVRLQERVTVQVKRKPVQQQYEDTEQQYHEQTFEDEEEYQQPQLQQRSTFIPKKSKLIPIAQVQQQPKYQQTSNVKPLSKAPQKQRQQPPQYIEEDF